MRLDKSDNVDAIIILCHYNVVDIIRKHGKNKTIRA